MQKEREAVREAHSLKAAYVIIIIIINMLMPAPVIALHI
jgi:hypothetical protein